MLRRLRHRFLLRLAAPEDLSERLRIERVLASARVFLTGTGIVAVYLDPTEPLSYARLAYLILIAYFLWGLIAWTQVHRAEKIGAFRNVVHFFDIVFPLTFMLFTAGPNSPFFVFLLYVLVAAAFRWGLPETMVTATIVIGLLCLEASLLSYGPAKGWIEGEYEINRFVIRISYLLTLGLLVGYLGEEEKQWRAENSTITRLLNTVHAENGLRASMQEVLQELTRIFRSPRALIVLHQAGTERIFLWRMLSDDGVVHSSEVEPELRSRFAVPIPANTLLANKRGQGWRCWAIGTDSRKIKVPSSFDPATFPESNGATSILATSLSIGEEWNGCALLFDVVTGPGVYSEIRFAQNLMHQIGPALYTVFLVRRLRSRAGAIERARVARELHDGAIQALISVEMRVDVLRRQMGHPEKAAVVQRDLETVQDLLRQQIFELRMLMQQMKPVEFRPGQLLDYMAETVERFRRDSGISAQFVTSLEDAHLPARVARELVRILQEALVNVRKHSCATSVNVRFATEDGCWKMGIVDNGRGFDFNGKLTLAELESSRRGPAIIKERVRSLGGQLTLQSTPGTGSELEVAFPHKLQRTYD